MRSGQLRNLIAIQKLGTGVNEWNEPDPDSWVEHAKVWASVRHLSGTESIKAGVDTSTVRASIRIRWRTDITSGMRAVHMGNLYDIEAALPGAKREFVDLACKLVKGPMT